MFFVFLATGYQVEYARQDEDGGALGKPSNDAKDECEVVDEDGADGHDEQVGEADEQVEPGWQLVLRLDLTLDRLAHETHAEVHLAGLVLLLLPGRALVIVVDRTCSGVGCLLLVLLLVDELVIRLID